MGAAGRDFHDFLRFFRDQEQFHVCCFTAYQIPFIEKRTFPASLAGSAYPEGIPIYPEEKLTELIREHDADFVFLSYSDLSHEEVMHRASTVQAAGASFALLGPKHTQLRSRLPMLSVTASRTGAGKSPLSQAIAGHLTAAGKRVGVLRHPMPYGDLSRQKVQRFATRADLTDADCTVEEREEYEPYVDRGLVIYAGVDYAEILKAAESESDVILWDGGNNDSSFLRPGLSIVVVDALRAGHEMRYYPGETNLRSADVVVINKVKSAKPADIDTIRANINRTNPNAEVIESDLEVAVDDEAKLTGKRALVLEDGPTVTHGGMAGGAGIVAAERYGVAEIVDPRPHAVGTVAQAFSAYPHLERVLPALGYSEEQRAELAETIHRAAPEVVIDASPAGLRELLDLDLPVARVSYSFQQLAGRPILEIVDEFLR